MALDSWMWNLGMLAAVSSVAACRGAEATEDDCDYETDGCGYSSGYSYYEDSYDEEEDVDEEPECSGDADCRPGTCMNPGQPSAHCELPPPIPTCEEEAKVELTWVRQGEGAGAGVGVTGRVGEPRKVLLTQATVEGESIPVSLADLEADALPETLPVTPAEDEVVVGAEQADLDADGDFDLLVTVRNLTRTRVVPLLTEAAGTRLALEPVVFEGAGAGAKLRRLEDGTFSLFVLSLTGELAQAPSVGDGSFAAPVPSPWDNAEIVDFAVAPMGGQRFDDVLAVRKSAETSFSAIEAVLGGVKVTFGLSWKPRRRVFADVLAGFFVATDASLDEITMVQTAFAEANATENRAVVHHSDNPVRDVAMTDLDGDGRGELVMLHRDGSITVVYSVSSRDACSQRFETGSGFDVLLALASGTGEGVVLSGPGGVLSVRG